MLLLQENICGRKSLSPPGIHYFPILSFKTGKLWESGNDTVLTQVSDLDMTSFDVDSLFTYTPSDKPIDIWVKKCFRNSKNNFHDLLNLATKK